MANRRSIVFAFVGILILEFGMEHVQVFYPQEHSELVMKSGAGICWRGKAW